MDKILQAQKDLLEAMRLEKNRLVKSQCYEQAGYIRDRMNELQKTFDSLIAVYDFEFN